MHRVGARRAAIALAATLLAACVPARDAPPPAAPPAATAPPATKHETPPPAAKSEAAPRAAVPARAPEKVPPKTAAAAPKTPPAPPAPPAPHAPSKAAPPLDLRSLEQRLKETQAIGVLTKLSLKNQVDDLVGRFRSFHAGQRPPTLTQLRPAFELLLMKVLSLLQDHDTALARDINASREAIWGVLADPSKLAQYSGQEAR
jgi:hypothetical protein